MKVDYSKSFEKSVRKLSGKMLESVKRVIQEDKAADNIQQITESKHLDG